MEKWLTLRIAATSRGRLEVKGTLLDRAGDGNQLTFKIEAFNQSYLPNIIVVGAYQRDDCLSH